MSGTKHEQTHRAKEFTPPQRSRFNWLYVFAPVAMLLIASFVPDAFNGVIIPSLFVEGASSASSAPSEGLEPLHNMMQWLMPAFGIVTVIGAGIYFLFVVPSRIKDEETRLEKASVVEDAREAVYNRLRYVEADHIVFDPETGKEVAATASEIRKLIADLADRSVRTRIPQTG